MNEADDLRRIAATLAAVKLEKRSLVSALDLLQRQVGAVTFAAVNDATEARKLDALRATIAAKRSRLAELDQAELVGTEAEAEARQRYDAAAREVQWDQAVALIDQFEKAATDLEQTLANAGAACQRAYALMNEAHGTVGMLLGGNREIPLPQYAGLVSLNFERYGGPLCPADMMPLIERHRIPSVAAILRDHGRLWLGYRPAPEPSPEPPAEEVVDAAAA